jgi:hypothetical protein
LNQRTLRSGIADELFLPGDIAGIEVYSTAAEFPAQFNATRSPGSGPACLTLIWTK